MSEAEAIICPLEAKKGVNPRIQREFRRFYRAGELRLPLVLDWMATHEAQWNRMESFTFVERVLIDPSLEISPLARAEAIRCVEALIARADDKKQTMARLCFRYFLMLLRQEDSKCVRRLMGEVKAIANDRSYQQLASKIWVLGYAMIERPFSAEVLAFGQVCYSLFGHISRKSALVETIRQLLLRDQMSLSSQLSPKHLGFSGTEWTGCFPRFDSEDLTIDFNQMAVIDHTLPPDPYHMEIEVMGLCPEGLQQLQFRGEWKQIESGWEREDQQLRLKRASHSSFILQVKIQGHWYELTQKGAVKDSGLSSPTQFWFQEIDGGDWAYLDLLSWKVLARVKGDGVYRSPGKERLCLAAVGDFVLPKLAPTKRVCWARADGEELATVEWSTLGFSLRWDGAHWVSPQYPGYRLDRSWNEHLLVSEFGAAVLVNQAEERIVILAAGEKRFEYTVVDGAFLHTLETEAKLCLVHHLMRLRKYPEALQQLKGVQPARARFKAAEQRWIDLMVRLQDLTPNGIAFSLHLRLFLRDRLLDQPIPGLKFEISSGRGIIWRYEQYVRALAKNEGIGSIDCALVLNPEQELAIIALVEKADGQSFLAACRKELLTKGSFEGEFNASAILADPFHWSTVAPLSVGEAIGLQRRLAGAPQKAEPVLDRVRLTKDDWSHSFEQLYNKAANSPKGDPFALTLVHAARTKDLAARALFYIWHNQERFKELCYPKDADQIFAALVGLPNPEVRRCTIPEGDRFSLSEEIKSEPKIAPVTLKFPKERLSQTELKKRIDTANHPVLTTHAERHNFQMERHIGTQLTLEPTGELLRALMLRDPRIIARCRPSFSQKQIDQLLSDTLAYFARGLADKHGGGVLNRYPICAYPQLLCYEALTGRMARQDQIEVIQWATQAIDKREHRLFSAPAGFGKTTFVLPVLLSEAIGCGRVPFVMVNRSVMKLMQELVGSYLVPLERHLISLELTLDSVVDLKKASKILQALQRAMRYGKGVMLTPEGLYRLMLAKKELQLNEPGSQLHQILMKIERFMADHGFLFVDESHQNLNPLCKGVIAAGELSSPELWACDWLIELIGIAEKMKWDRRTVAAWLAQKCRVEQQYFTRGMSEYSVEGKSPQELERLGIARHFVLDLMPAFVELAEGKSHKESDQVGRFVEVPCNNGKRTGAEYEDPYLALCLSYKGVMERGLSLGGLQALLIRLKQEAMQQIGHEEAFALMEQFLQGKSSVYDFNPAQQEQVKQLLKRLQRDPVAIREFLKRVVLPEVGYAEKVLEVTPAHVLQLFTNGSILFSATPGHRLSYPGVVHDERRDPSFLPAVGARMKDNSEVIVSEVEGSDERIQEALSVRSASVIIDPGGELKRDPNREVALSLMKHGRLKGVIYFDDQDGVPMMIAAGKMQESRFDSRKPIPEGFGVYFDLEHVEAADLKVPKGAHALLFAGKQLCFETAAQALLRMRGWLKKEQTSSWVFSKPVWEKVIGDDITRWLQKNSRRVRDRRLSVAAFQRIEAKKGSAQGYKQESQSAWERYGTGGRLEETRQALTRFAGRAADRGLKVAIKEVAQIVPKISLSGVAGSGQVHRHSQVQQLRQVERSAKQVYPIDWEHHKLPDFSDPDFPARACGDGGSTSAKRAYFALIVGDGLRVSLGHKWCDVGMQVIKPTDFVLLFPKTLQMVMIAQREAASLKEQMQKARGAHCAILMSAGGQLIELSGIEEEQARTLVAQEQVQQLLQDVALLKGHVVRAGRLKDRIEVFGAEGFACLWKRICQKNWRVLESDRRIMEVIFESLLK